MGELTESGEDHVIAIATNESDKRLAYLDQKLLVG